MTKQDYLQMLRDSTKQGAIVVKKDGTTRPLTDFERGIAMGRYKEICERAEFLNKKSKDVKPQQGYKNNNRRIVEAAPWVDEYMANMVLEEL